LIGFIYFFLVIHVSIIAVFNFLNVILDFFLIISLRAFKIAYSSLSILPLIYPFIHSFTIIVLIVIVILVILIILIILIAVVFVVILVIIVAVTKDVIVILI
jgi:hypothetical protein